MENLVRINKRIWFVTDEGDEYSSIWFNWKLNTAAKVLALHWPKIQTSADLKPSTENYLTATWHQIPNIPVRSPRWLLSYFSYRLELMSVNKRSMIITLISLMRLFARWFNNFMSIGARLRLQCVADLSC